MTSRQRVEDALQHRTPDRTPMFEYVLLSPLADIFLGRPYAADPDNWSFFEDKLGWEGALRQSARDRVELAAILGHDLIYATPNPLPPPTRQAQLAGTPTLGDDPLENLKLRNAFDATRLQPQQDSLLIYPMLQEEMARRDLDLPLLAPAYAHGVWTDVDLMQTMALDPPTAQAHFKLATAQMLALIDQYIALGLHQVGIGGDFSGTRPIISPRFYRSFILPELRQISEHLHRAGLYAVNASDGNLWPVIDDFLLTSGVDAYLEIDLHAGMDLRQLKALYGERITFYGNLDCGLELSFGSPEQVRQHTLDCLENGLGNGGHILCASNAIIASIPLENYLATQNAYRDFFSLPRLVVN